MEINFFQCLQSENCIYFVFISNIIIIYDNAWYIVTCLSLKTAILGNQTIVMFNTCMSKVSSQKEISDASLCS